MHSIFLAFIHPRIADYTQKKKQEMSLGSITFGASVSSFSVSRKNTTSKSIDLRWKESQEFWDEIERMGHTEAKKRKFI